MPHPAARPGARGGFTIIELMGVIVIMGLIGTVVMVSWQAMGPNSRLNSAVRNLSEHIASARSEAIARNHEFQIHYDLDNERYWVRSPYRLGAGFATYDEEPRVLLHETELGQWGLEIARVTIDDRPYEDGVVSVRFDPLGASAAHTVLLYQTLFERYFTLEILPLTREIRFHDGLYERQIPQEGEFD
ncbi:MAG: GspH/FimT family pseudopilin [Planctomycetota bacterium]|nr:GspH/FimT family pseudopilin [Planctomycetota bacterium]